MCLELKDFWLINGIVNASNEKNEMIGNRSLHPNFIIPVHLQL